ncbi:SUMO ligase siz1 [Pseudogymnoascus verrucosus]|uniref:SUMO ligase siz1 n=1 Tax=Pseudogymnoascus verrucosus TaxID=342668 RepID=A0A1B8GTC8_9PEZI|nr:SUMO ligase siz1 [Pseudogymnoascus verrucosus]OBT99089.2 SUMO ligase siz1 [Pseudogymnoascus verrucosus]
MASMGGGNLDPVPLIRILKGPRMLNKYLTAICKSERIPCAGAVKAIMQQRIQDNIEKYVAEGNVVKFNNIKSLLSNPEDALFPNGGYAPYSSSPAAPSPRPAPGIQAPRYMANGMGTQPVLDFKPSPFYTLQRQIGDVKTCPAMAAHRNNVEISVQAQNWPILGQIETDKSLRVMAFCSSDPGTMRQDISFPHQSEIKVNGGDVKANLRGLKNKPGSTRPVDLTPYLRLKPSQYPNKIEMTYALTTKTFYFMVSVVKTVAVEELRKKIENGKKLSKESVINEMVSKAADPDIVATSTVLSLKCPLSTLRMDLPCRSTACRHNQCFDATSYLQLQEQGPTWLCPICNNSATFETLAVDDYVRDIITNTPRSVDQVTIEPDGKWSTNTRTPSPSRGNQDFDIEGDDDIIEIKDSKFLSIRNHSTPGTSASTPPTSLYSREPSTAMSAPRPSNKRPASSVIDLTLSDEDDEPISRAPKRQSTAAFGATQVPHYATPGRS